MKHIAGKVGLILIGLTILAACSQRDRGLADLVPADALAFAQVSDFDSVLKNVQAFSDGVGVKDILPIGSVRDLLSVGLGTLGGGLTIEDVDLTKPAGIAVLAPESGSADPGIIAYLPFKKPADVLVKLHDVLAGSQGKLRAVQSNAYLMFTNTPESQKLPPAKSFALPDYVTLEKGGISVYGDVASVLKHFDKDWAQLKTEMLSGISSAESKEGKLLGASAELSSAMMNSIFSAVEQAQGAAFHIRADAKGLWSTVQVGLDKNGTLSKLLDKAGSGSKVTDAASYVPEGYLFGGSLQSNPDLWESLSSGIVDLYSKSATLKDSDKAFMKAVMQDYSKYAGNQSTVAVDLDYDPQVFSRQDLDPITLSKAISFKVLLSMDSKDPKGFVNHIKTVVADPALQTYMSDLMSPGAFALKISTEDKKAGDLDYTLVSYKIEATDLSGLKPNDPILEGIKFSSALMDRLTLSVAAKGNKVYVTVADPEGSELKDFTSRDAAEKPLSASAAWKEYAATIPADAQSFSYFSLPRIFDLLKKSPAGQVFDVDIPADARTGIFGYTRVKDGVIEAQSFWSTKELAPVVKKAVTFMQMMMSGN